MYLHSLILPLPTPQTKDIWYYVHPCIWLRITLLSSLPHQEQYGVNPAEFEGPPLSTESGATADPFLTFFRSACSLLALLG